ncbi:GGDEF domain-containing protein [Selenomonas sp. ND2010]|uniref:transporter substrate-binding domain-containing diguanylate cyclase n=1 Tax=Selenomonas sp. ND2010 TaxID=1410618 RepID=UPI00051C3C66|nr:GGDEF domain-containing protein [Selenomonas sp. ND2010]
MIKRIFSVMLLFCLILSTTVTATAPKLRIGYIEPDQSILSSIYMRNYYNSYLDELAKHAGWNYELVDVSITDSVKRLTNGDIDLLLSAENPYTDTPSDKFAFSQECFGFDIESLYTRAGDRRYNAHDLSTIMGAKVGLIKNRHANVQFMTFQHDNELSFDLHYFDTQDQLVKALVDQEIDLAVDTATNCIPGEQFLLAFARIPVRVASRLNDSTHLREFETAMNCLRVENPSFEPNLKKQLTQRIDHQLTHYTPAESRFIETAEPLRIVIFGGSAPYIELDDSTGIASGIYADLLNLISRNSGLRFSYLHVKTYEEAIAALENGEADIMMDIYNNQPDEIPFTYTNSFFTVPYTLIGAFEAKTSTTTGKFRVSMFQPMPSLVKYLQQEYPDWEINSTAKSSNDSLNMVARGEADFALINNINLETERNLILHPDLTIVPGVNVQVPMSLAIADGQPRILKTILNKAIIQIDPQDLVRIMQQHTVATKPNLSISHLLAFYPIQTGLAIGLFLLLFAGGIFLWHYGRKLKHQQILLEEKNQVLQTTINTLAEVNRSRDNYKTLAETDALTGLLNKAAIEQAGKAILATPPAPERCHALFIIDLDHFKEANDTMGHQKGDDILRRFALCLMHIVRANDALGRFGGDEFILILENLPRPAAIAIATRINTAARNLELHADGSPALSASIGIALSPAHGTTYADLLHNADQALYQTKENGRDNWTLAFYKNKQ